MQSKMIECADNCTWQDQNARGLASDCGSEMHLVDSERHYFIVNVIVWQECAVFVASQNNSQKFR